MSYCMNLSAVSVVTNKFVSKIFILYQTCLVFICFIPCGIYADVVANVTIHESDIISPVNRNILGNNIIGYMKPYKKGRAKLYFDTTGGGIWDPVSKTFDSDYLRLIKEAGVTVLRWPGGPWLDSLQWKNLVGPASKRPDNTFGLPEFLVLCNEIGAQPVITLPTKDKQLAQIPDLVEYLNSVDNGTNPGGGVDWAKVRTSDGHKRPWNVKWFEFGNETFGQIMSPEEYVEHYNSTYNKIIKVDNTVKLGAVMEDSDNTINSWNQTVLAGLGDRMGFAIVHPYYPVIKNKEAKYYSEKTIALSTMASDELIISRLKELNSYIKLVTGRDDIPLAATEYNGNFVQNEPVKFRFTLFNAIHNANYVRIFLDPASNVLFANHWQLVNTYWGMIREKKKNHKPLIKQANYYVYKIYNNYLSDNLIKIYIDGPDYTFSGAAKVSARKGKKVEGSWHLYDGTLPDKWSLRLFGDVEQTQAGGVVTAKFNNKDFNYYHASKSFRVKPDTLYRVSVKVKAIGIAGGKVGVAVEDVRGWTKTYNQPANIQLKGTTEWRWVSTQIRTLPDATMLRVMARRLKGKGKIRGVVKFSDLRVEESDFHPGSIQSIVGLASKSNKNDIINIILMNRELNKVVKAVIRVPSGYRVDHAVKLSGPTPYTTNFKPVKGEKIFIKNNKYDVKNNVMTISLPAMSMNAISFKASKK